jgi:hypothetical protein
VILTIEKHKVSLLIDIGASISAIPFFSRPRSSKKITVWVYQASLIISLSLKPAPGKISTSVTPF